MHILKWTVPSVTAYLIPLRRVAPELEPRWKPVMPSNSLVSALLLGDYGYQFQHLVPKTYINIQVW